ncbi:MAG: hypothetical protein HY077_14235 [Elusimicrobia bacterium]|nr:hypothetical protein [Elusimicrobiota bacterium]
MSLSPRAARGGAVLLLIAAVILAYGPILSNGFVNWDDDLLLLRETAWRGLGASNLNWMLTSLSAGAYQPLTWVVFAVIFRLQGLAPMGYHLASLLFHTANSCVLFLLLQTLSMRAGSRAGALLAALLWAVHPVQAQVVAWATPLADLMATFFCLLSLLAYVRAARAPRRGPWLAVSAALFAASGLCRWKGWALPLALVFLDLQPLERMTLGTCLQRRSARVWLEKVPFLAISAALVAVNALAKSQTPGRFQLGFRPEEAAAALLLCLSKLLAPLGLIPLYAFNGSLNPLGWSAPLCLAAVGAATLGLAALADKRPAPLGAWLFFVASVLPPLVFTPPGPVFASLAYVYLATLGFAALAAAGLERSRAARICALALLPLLTGASRLQCARWHDSISLWSHALAVDPDAYVARNNLASALAEAGREPEALEMFADQLKRRPDDDVARRNLELLSAALRRDRTAK